MSIKSYIGFSLFLTLAYALGIGFCIVALDNLSSGNVGKLSLATAGIMLVIIMLAVIVRKLDNITDNEV